MLTREGKEVALSTPSHPTLVNHTTDRKVRTRRDSPLFEIFQWNKSGSFGLPCDAFERSLKQGRLGAWLVGWVGGVDFK